MIVFPNCKINLGLYVKNKRADGFHNIETVFYPVSLSDVLEIIKAKKETKIHIKGIKIPDSKNSNLCIKAYELIRKDHDIPPVDIYLYKKIPAGAGLGGGSSDGAFTIKLLNTMFSLNLSVKQMQDYAQKLGSDCAFFINNKPSFACEKGNKLEPAKPDIDNYYISLVKPDISINTKAAYSEIKPCDNRKSIKEIIRQPIDTWKKELSNDFEKIVFKKYPEIKSIKDRMYEAGAIYASMSGSGSAVYGIFDKKTDILPLFSKYFVWQGYFAASLYK